MRRLACLAAFLPLSGAAVAAESVYLFDALRQHSYRIAWDKLLKEVQPTPDWLRQFDKDYDGAAGQMISITIDGKAYELSFVCKPEDCAGRKFEVLFEAGGAKAFGALGGKDNAPAFYGAPPPSLQDALAKAIKE